jgi:sulfatase modifying factor 1
MAARLWAIAAGAGLGAFVLGCGGPKWPGDSKGCPEGMVAIERAFCIDRFEATLVETMPSGAERSFPPNEPVRGRTVRAVARDGVLPQGYISRNEAEAACRASRKRLCAEKEWVKACRGPRSQTFPYGNVEEKSVCNDSGVSPLLRLYAGSGQNPYADAPMNDPRLNRMPKTLEPTGEKRRCVNDFGVYDMVGNLHEWVADPNGTFLGGYYLDTRLNGRGCNYKTTAHDATYHDYSTGFRCCADIER